MEKKPSNELRLNVRWSRATESPDDISITEQLSNSCKHLSIPGRIRIADVVG